MLNYAVQSLMSKYAVMNCEIMTIIVKEYLSELNKIREAAVKKYKNYYPLYH